MFGPCIVMQYLVLILVLILRKRKLVTLLLLSYKCIVTVNVLWLFLTMPWVGLQCVIVEFPDHNHYFSVLSIFAIISLSRRGLVVLL